MNSTANSIATMEISKPHRSLFRILPDEILVKILAHLSKPDLISLLIVSKQVYRVAWEQLYKHLIFAHQAQIKSFKKCVEHTNDTAILKTTKSIYVCFELPLERRSFVSSIASLRFLASFSQLRYLTYRVEGPMYSEIYMRGFGGFSIDSVILSLQNLKFCKFQVILMRPISIANILNIVYYDALPVYYTSESFTYGTPLLNFTAQRMLGSRLHHQNLETLKLRYVDFWSVENYRPSMLTNLMFDRCPIRVSVIAKFLSSMVQIKRLSFIQCSPRSKELENIYNRMPTVGIPLRCIHPTAGSLEILEIQTLEIDCGTVLSGRSLSQDKDSLANFKRLCGLQISCEHFIVRTMNHPALNNLYVEAINDMIVENKVFMPSHFSRLVFGRGQQILGPGHDQQLLLTRLGDFFPPALEILHLTVQTGLLLDYIIKNIALLIRNIAKMKDICIPKLRRLTISGMLKRCKEPPRWFKPKCKAAGVELIWIRMEEGDDSPFLDMD